MQRGEFNKIRTTTISLFILCLVFSKGLFAAEEKSVKLPEAKLPSANAKPSVVGSNVVPDRNTTVKTAVSYEDVRVVQNATMLAQQKKTTIDAQASDGTTVSKSAYDLLYGPSNELINSALMNVTDNPKAPDTFKNGDFKQQIELSREAIADVLHDKLAQFSTKDYARYYKLAQDPKLARSEADKTLISKIDAGIEEVFPGAANGQNKALNNFHVSFKNGALQGDGKLAVVIAMGIKPSSMGMDDKDRGSFSRQKLNAALHSELNQRNEGNEKYAVTYKLGGETGSNQCLSIEEVVQTFARQKLNPVADIAAIRADKSYNDINPRIVERTNSGEDSLPRQWAAPKYTKPVALPEKPSSTEQVSGNAQTQIAAEREAQIDLVAQSLIALSAKKGEFTPEETRMVFNAFNYRSKEVSDMLFNKLTSDVLDGLTKNLPDDLESQFISRRMDRSFNATRVMNELTAAANNKSYIKNPDKLLEIISMSLTTSNFNSDFIQKNLKMLDHECIKAEGINLATFLQETLMKVRRDSSKYPVIQNVVKVLNDL